MLWPDSQPEWDRGAVDNRSEGLAELRRINQIYRKSPWPEEFRITNHNLFLGDSRDLSSFDNESIELIVTSPPYWTLKEYEPLSGQLGCILEYNSFLKELSNVWRECARVLVPGGRLCCIVGDVCLSRRRVGRHHILPLHSDIQVNFREHGLDCLTPIIWSKIANGATEVQGSSGTYYGKPFQPGGIIKNDIEYILLFRKGGKYRSPTIMQKALSMLTKEEVTEWFRSVWTDVKGESTKNGHPAPFPVEIASRLIRMFSFAGDTVLDPFMGIGSSNIAAMSTGRSSIGIEIDQNFLMQGNCRLEKFRKKILSDQYRNSDVNIKLHL